MRCFLALLFLFGPQMGVCEGILKVAVIDNGLNLEDPRFVGVLCPGESKDFSGEGIVDKHGHGTHIAGLIKQYAGPSGYCLMILKYYRRESDGMENLINEESAIDYAVVHGAGIVNFSGGGALPFAREEHLIRQAKGTLFVVAAGNEGLNSDFFHFYPANYKYPNIIPVGAYKAPPYENVPMFTSNYGPSIKAWEVGQDVLSTLPDGTWGYMSGTSQATAIRTGKIIRQHLKRSN